MWPESALGQLLAALERHYGPAARPDAEGPFAMVLWEIVAYMADDEKRAKAFAALRERVGLRPAEILQASMETLREITRMGGAIAANERADRLRLAAKLGDLEAVRGMPFPKAKKLLMQYPMIGEPGAEKILLFCGVLPVLALESNGLRVLVRNGIGEERKSYAATYRSVREAVMDELPKDCDLLVAAHLLLRRHGQELCLRNDPACRACPLRDRCPSAI